MQQRVFENNQQSLFFLVKSLIISLENTLKVQNDQ